MKRTKPTHELDMRVAVTLRALLAIGLGLVVLSSLPSWGLAGLTAQQTAGWILLGFLVSNLPLLVAGVAAWRWRPFDLLLVTFDTLLVSLLLFPVGGTRLALVFFLVLLLVALGERLSTRLVGATVVASMDAGLAITAGAPVTPFLLLRVPFFYAVALYYGYFVGQARLLREEVERARGESRELRAVVRILEEVASSLDLQQVMRKVVSCIAEVLPCERISILFMEHDGRTATVLASSDDPDFEPLQIDLDKYPEVCQAVRDQEAILLEDARHHALLEPVQDLIRHIPFNSILVAPLVFADRTVGTLMLRAASHRMDFQPEQVRFCRAVANASANALKNALLYQETMAMAGESKATAAELAHILDHSPDLIIAADGEGRILRWNRGAERILGRAAEEVLECPLEELLPHLATEAVLRGVAAGRPLVDHAAVLRRPDGSTAEVDLTLVSLYPPDDERGGFLLVGRDVTELNASRNALQRADRLSALGEIASGVAHELNNPLSNILGHAQLLAAFKELPEEARKRARGIVESAKRCRRISRNLLGFSRRQQPEKMLVSVTDLVNTVLDLLSFQLKNRDVRIAREIDPGLPSIVLDPHRMEQVLLNLVQNAARSLHRQGRPGTITLRAAQEDGTLTLEVADDGPGVPPEIRGKIFEPFFTTRGKEGTGLGLSIATGIVQEHGGTLDLVPGQGPGATFRVSLPMRFSPGARSSGTASTAASPESESRRALLVVTDDAPLRRLLERSLRPVGYRTDAVPDGLSAANLLRDPSRYLLILADLKAAAPNGAALAERFGKDVPFVLMTDDQELARRYDTGGRGRPWPVLRHPCEPKEVLEVVARLLERVDRGREATHIPSHAAKA